MNSIMNRVGIYLSAVIILFAPFSMGAVHPWSLAVFKSLVLALGFCFILKMVGGERGLIKNRPYNYVMLAIFGFILLQAVPLPAFILKTLSPLRYDTLYGSLQELGIGSSPSFIPITMAPHATKEAFSLVLFYAVLLVSLQGFMKDRHDIKFLSRALIISGFLVGLLAIAQRFSGAKGIYWLITTPYQFYGPFINPNHAAVYIGSISILTFVHFVRETRITKAALGFILAIMILAVLYSLSRGGILALFIPLAFLMLLLALRRRSGSRSINTNIFATIFLFASVATLLLFWGTFRVFGELGTLADPSSTLDFRLKLWSSALDIFKDYPFFGSGFGTFEAVIPFYRTFQGNVVIEVAENDWLELLSGTGFIGFSVILLFAFFVARRMARILSRTKTAVPRSHLGAIFALSSIALSSFISFNLAVPGVMVPAIFFLALISLETKRFG